MIDDVTKKEMDACNDVIVNFLMEKKIPPSLSISTMFTMCMRVMCREGITYEQVCAKIKCFYDQCEAVDNALDKEKSTG
jgi:hypothetical protein